MAVSILCRVGLGLLIVSSRVEAQNAEGPYSGTPASVPGVIEAEQFDFGGEGVGYSDSTLRNIQKAFRPNEAVDIHALDKGGYNIGYITVGEYLRFSVNVTEDVDVSFFNFVVSSAKSTGSFHLVSGGTGCNDYTTDLSGIVAVPYTGGWQEYINMAVSGGSGSGLKAGPAFIWLCPLSETFNIDYFTLKASANPKGAYGGPAIVPGHIEAEEFDYGGEGVGYSDTTAANIPGSFRGDVAVDIHALDNGGYNIAYIAQREYLRYTVMVTENFDSFNFNFVVSSDMTTGVFRIVSGGTGCVDFTTDLTGVVAVPDTGGWQKYENLTVPGRGGGRLAAGKTQIWLCVLSETFNIDSFTMEGVITPSGAYGGTPPSVPGLIEAEDFDFGGQGLAYYDITPANLGKAYRTDERVDIEALDGGGYKVSKFTKGEFLRYTVDVTEDVDAFLFSFVISSSRPSSFQIVSGGTGCKDFTTNLSGLVTLPNTGGFSTLKTVQVSGLGDGGLAAGPAVIWVCVIKSTFNIDSFTMSVDEVKSTPYSGAPISIPGLIEAEFFDKGGQSLAYYDTTPRNKGKVFRTKEAVDIGSTNNGYFVGWITNGEYLQYTVDISAGVAAFNFSFRVAAPKKRPGSFRIVAGGKACDDYTTDLSGLVSVPATGWSKFKDVKVRSGGSGGLPAGEATIRLCVVGARFSIDSFVMEYK